MAVAPDGKHAYVANYRSASVIDTATNAVTTTIAVGFCPSGVAVAPDGKHAYVTNFCSNSVSVIDTATNAVAATIAVGLCPQEVAVAPDGKHAYVTNSCSNSVSVIDTAANAVSATIGAVASPFSVAVAPDGKHAYVTSPFGTVSVIDAAANVVSATIRVGAYALDIAVAQAAGIPFTAFSAKLDIAFGSLPNQDSFELKSSFTLSSASNGINPLTDPVTLKVGSFSVTIPTGSFTSNKKGFYHFDGVIGGVSLQVLIKPTATLQYVFKAEATGVNLTGTPNPVSVTLTIGNNTGTVSINAGS